MSFYDIVILVVLFGAMFFGYTKGLAWQIASVAAVVVSYIAAVRFRGQVAQFVQADPPYNTIAAMLIIFVATSLVIWLAYAYVNKSLERAELDGFNRQIGALVGAVLGVLLVMVITLFSVSLWPSVHDSIHQSKLGPYVVRGISMAQAFVPDEFKASLDPHFEKFYQQIGSDVKQTPGFQGFGQNVIPGGSQYPTGQTFNSNSQNSYEGNWSAAGQASQPTQNAYQNGGYQTSSYQPNSNQSNGFQTNGYQTNGYPPSQTQTGYPPAQSNQGTNYFPPQQQQQPQAPALELKLDAQDLLNGAGQLFKNNFQNP